MSYIYKISNDLNNFVYIGQTKGSIQARFKEHCYDSKRDCQNKFHKAIKDLGVEHFKVELIEECPNSQLDEREKYWIAFYDSYNNGYNSNKGGQSSLTKTTPEECIKYYLDNKDTKTLTQITKELGVGTNNLRELLQEAGIREKQFYVRYEQWSDEEKENMKKDILNGCTLNYLISTYHHDARTIKKFMEENNLMIPSSKTNTKTPIWQLDLEGNFIAEWESIYAAKEYFNNRHIGECVNGKRKTASGYKWIKKPTALICSEENKN